MSAVDQAHPRLRALIERARTACAARGGPLPVAVAHPCDAPSLQAADAMRRAGVAQPILVGPLAPMAAAADAGGVALGDFECVPVEQPGGPAAAAAAVALARQGRAQAVMKGSLHTDELLSEVLHRERGIRGQTRMTHAFVFDLPRYPKLLALADCVVNIAPDLATKQAIVHNAVELLRRLGVQRPKVAVLSAVETVTPAIPATLDAQALVDAAAQGQFGDAIVEGPFGFDNAFSAEAARIKGMRSVVAGDADLMLVPDLNAGNILYKSFVHAAGAECGGLVLGTRVPVILASRADSSFTRLASAALAALAASTEGVGAPGRG